MKAYIDAFAGTGYREARQDDRTENGAQTLLLPDLAGAEPQALLDGSARLALKTDPRFDRYIFIERSAERCAQLELLREEFPALAADIQIRRGDANAEIRDLCAKDWSSHRAVEERARRLLRQLRRGEDGAVRLPRGVLQPAPSPFDARPDQSGRFRAPHHRCVALPRWPPARMRTWQPDSRRPK